jgi:AraC family transcriptional regulator
VTIHDVRCRPHDHAHGPEEWSTVNQIVFPRSGLFMREAAGEQVLGDSNQVLFFRKHEAYRVAHPAGCGDDCTVFGYADDVLLEAFAAHEPRVQERPEQPFSFSHSPNQPELFLLHERLRQATYRADSDTLALDEAALTLLAGVVKNAYRLHCKGPARATATATLRMHREQAQRTQLLLAARFTENLTLDEIAHAVHCSPFHLARLFRRQTGLSVHQYRNRLRLAEALERVLAGEPNLSALALALGFSSHAHLSDAFQRTFGVAPSSCRNALSAARLQQMSRNLKVELPRRP